jgi:hypothetical protein
VPLLAQQGQRSILDMPLKRARRMSPLKRARRR